MAAPPSVQKLMQSSRSSLGRTNAQCAGISRNPSIPRRVQVYGGGVSDRPEIFTVGELRASGHVHKDLRREIRDNLLAAWSWAIAAN